MVEAATQWRNPATRGHFGGDPVERDELHEAFRARRPGPRAVGQSPGEKRSTASVMMPSMPIPTSRSTSAGSFTV